ncbi:MAG: hypothetical protein FWG02_10720 [Holophagaceae bacterium]|nr:hypothetical protein [Holophagaceae bacterium]
MKKTILSYLIFILLFIVPSFSQENQEEKSAPLKGVFVVGTVQNTALIQTATIWKDGQARHLSDGTKNTWATSVFIVDDIAWIAGYQAHGDEPSVALLWKNADVMRLTDGKRDSVASSVFVSDGDVYVVGYETNEEDKAVAMLWKNGYPQHLSNGKRSAYAKSVFVSGKTVYVVGHEYNDADKPVATLWTNGRQRSIGGAGSAAKSIFVSDSNTYIAGYETNTQENTYATVWKNGSTRLRLTNGDSQAEASAVYVSGSDIYAVGYDSKYNKDGNHVAVLWKNRIAQILGDLTKHSMAESIFVVDQTIYVAGFEDIKEEAATPIVWKNSTPLYRLPLGDFLADSIAVFVK